MSAPWDNLFSVFACCRDSLQGRKFDPTFYQNALDAADICGIGIMFKSDMSGALFVSSVVPDGPAHKAGNIQEGDVLFEVDGVNVYRCPASHCASSLMGPRGSRVRICFLRRGTPIEVTMIRDFVQSGNGQNEANPSIQSDLDRNKRNPAFRTTTYTDGTRSTDEELERIKQKLDRQEKWAETLGPNSPFQEPAGRSGRRTPPQQRSPRAMSSASAPDEAKSDGRTTPREEDPNIENIRKKLDRQDKWIEKIFQQDKAKKKAAQAAATHGNGPNRATSQT